jgi:hypothetical protein
LSDRVAVATAGVGIALMILTLMWRVNPVEGSVMPNFLTGNLFGMALLMGLLVTCMPVGIVALFSGILLGRLAVLSRVRGADGGERTRHRPARHRVLLPGTADLRHQGALQGTDLVERSAFEKVGGESARSLYTGRLSVRNPLMTADSDRLAARASLPTAVPLFALDRASTLGNGTEHWGPAGRVLSQLDGGAGWVVAVPRPTTTAGRSG